MLPQDNIQEPSYFDFLMNHRPYRYRPYLPVKSIPTAEPPPTVEEPVKNDESKENNKE